MKITPEPSFQNLTTLRLGGQARCLLVPQTDQDYEAIFQEVERYGGRLEPLGRGSNILAEDGEHDRVLLRRLCLREPKVVRETGSQVLVTVDAGMALPRFIRWCIQHGCSGLEPMSGIPGSLGGAVMMNAGSHGCECFDHLQAVRIWTPANGISWIDRNGCRAGYRSFALEGCTGVFAVLGVLMLLDRDSSDSIRKRVRSWLMRKKSVQPLGAVTAGCVFKNPLNGSAGRLLDEAGLRGYCLGDMRFSPVHANFLENTGKGTSAQALELIALAVERVKERWGVVLEPEVEILPCQ